MRKTILSAAVFCAFSTITKPQDTPQLGSMFTNQTRRVISVLGVSAVDTPCPECGGPNHHNREVKLMAVQDHIYVRVVYQGRTNDVLVSTGIISNYLSTNLVFKPNPYSYSPPPLPTPTNR